jgi:VanZ family protein
LKHSLRLIAPLLWMALIFWMSSRSTVGPDLPEFTRWIAHFTEYATLAALWFWALAPVLGRQALIAAAAISALYALSDEWHQSFVPGRDSDPKDFLIDCVGITAGLWLAQRVPVRRRPTSP